MASPPSRADLADTPTVATYKLAIGALYDYVASLLGNGTATIASETEKKLARESLGVGSFGFKNRFINPEFSVFQEFGGASVTIAAGSGIKYVIDQWYASASGANLTAQLIAGIADKKYSIRLTGSSGNTFGSFGQRVEATSCSDLKNQNVTVSFKSKATSDRTISWSAYYANSENNFTSTTSIATGTLNITTTANEFSFNFNAGSNAQNGIAIEFYTGAMGVSETIDFDGFQLEKSNVKTEFEARNIQQESAFCKRFFQVGASRWDGYVVSGNIYTVPVSFSVEMRAIPTLVLTNGVNTSFLNSPASYSLTTKGFFDARGSNATGGGSYVTFWTASARL